MKYCAQCGAQLVDEAVVCPQCGCPVQPQRSVDPNASPKSRLIALLLCVFVGGLGIHRFYVGKIGTGVLWLLTAGCFGIGALVERFDWLQRLILIVGGCIVVWIGIGLLRDKPTLDRDVDVSIPLPRLAAKAFVVTWINPQALIDGTMLFGSFRAGNPGAVASQLMLGSASASCLWFLGITILISFFSAKFNDKILRVINVVCGLIIIFYGAKLLLQFFQTLL